MRFLNPLSLWKKGWDWSGVSDRSEYIASLIWLYLPFLVTAALIPMFRGNTVVTGAGIVFLAVVLVPNFGFRLRRMNDAGLSGWWALLGVLPIVTLIFAIGLIFFRSSQFQVKIGWRRYGRVVTIVVSCILLLRLIIAPFDILSGSMKPALLPGDYVLATPAQSAKLGDIIVFRHPVQNTDYVKRVIAVAGDRVQLKSGKVFLNDVELEEMPMQNHREIFEKQGKTRITPLCRIDVDNSTMCTKFQTRQYLPNGIHFPILSTTENSRLDNTQVFVVPDEHVFVLGDNRDNSADSRIGRPFGPGFVPVENISHRASIVLFSLNRGSKTGTFLRMNRWFKRIK